MKCPFCGTENIAGRTHCIACATPLPVVAEPAVVSITEPALQQPIVPVEPVAMPTISNVRDQALAESHMPDPQFQASLSSGDTNPILEPVFSPSPSASLPNVVQAESIASASNSIPSWLEPNSAAEPIAAPVSEVTAPAAMPILEAPAPKVGESQQSSQPRVNVHFDEKEVEEVQMPVHQEQSLPEAPSMPMNHSVEDNKGGEGEVHTGPWLALTVLGGGLVLVILLVYFLYRLIFGGATEQTVTPQPTITSVPTISATPVPQLSVNDIQRERDADELKIALSSYYRDKQRYPSASTYNGLLNALIGGNYLTRRVQDPAFPGQEYKYTVDSSGSSYEIVITFDTVVSTLLQGSGSTVYRLKGSMGN